MQCLVSTPWPQMPRRCGRTKAKHTQSTIASSGPFDTAEGHETMTTTPYTSLLVNAGPHHARTRYAKPIFSSLASNASTVRPNQVKTHAIHNCLFRTIWHCRGPRNHDNDTADVATGQCWSTSCTHRVYKADFSLLGPKCPDGAAEPRPNTHNPQLPLQDHLTLPRAAKP